MLLIMTREEAKQQIEELVKNYQNLVDNRKISSYHEAQTRKDFIEPLFECLGWDMRNRKNQDEVKTEESVSKGRVDLAFYLKNIPVMFLEAKAMKANLDDWEWAKQAINYSWNKCVTWAILSDFEGIKVFSAEMQPTSRRQNPIIDLKWHNYIGDFDRLWLLSKESFKENKLTKSATEWGILTKRKPVNEKLFEDLTSWRMMLTKDLKQNNSNIADDAISEGVQKILDRIIFIRTAEDRKIEPNILQPLIHEWESSKKKYNLFERLNYNFHWFAEHYNSKLFASHALESWKADNEVLETIIKELYQTKEGYRYDFSAISTDVLGGIYEQYLGHVQDKVQKDDTKKLKRKSEGIYYTPKYIVEYLIEQTLGSVLKKAKAKDIANIKILDPACGSGSFLISAYDKMLEAKNKLDKQTGLFDRFEILKNNIYGVDLDDQAIEIAQLNLLLRVLRQRTKLPTLSHNIRIGNSLIDGDMNKLQQYFDTEWREKKAFNWKQEFQEVFENGGFDVVIGNPPYVSFYSKQSQANENTKQLLSYFINEYEFIENKKKLGRFNTLMFFIESAMKLLKDKGYLGFIVDTNIHSNPSEQLRKWLSQNYKIVKIVDPVRAFQGVASSQTMLIVQKQKPTKNHVIKYFKIDTDNLIQYITSASQSGINEKNRYSFKTPKSDNIKEILEKISSYQELYKIVGNKNIRTCITFTGKKEKFVTNLKERGIDYPLLEGSKSLPHPYAPLQHFSYVRYDLDLRDKLNEEYRKEAEENNKRSPKVIGLGDLELFQSPKVFIRLSDTRITASFTKEVYCADLSLYILTAPNKKVEDENCNLIYLLAILNSKVVTFYMRESYLIRNLKTGTPQIRLKDVRNIPIPEASKKEQAEVAKLAELMLQLQKEAQDMTSNTDKHARLKSEIEKLNERIDRLIYKLFNLNDQEIVTIENT